MHQIATAAEEQTAFTGEISTDIHQITDVVRQRCPSDQLGRFHLSQLASELKATVGKFKLA